MIYDKSSQYQERGCWTCRARRKRCDGRIPLCDTCKRLGITCSGFNSTKPRWMDGGREQQEYCNGLKKIIKRNRTRSGTSISTTPSFRGYEPPRPVGPDVEVAQTTEYMTSTTPEFTDIFEGLQTPPLFLDSASCFSVGMTSTESYAATPAAVFQDAKFTQTLNRQQSWMYHIADAPPIPESLDHFHEDSNIYFPEFEASVAPMYPTPQSTAAQLDLEIRDDVSINDTTLNTINWSSVMRYMDTTFYHIFPYLCRAAHDIERGWLMNMIQNSISVRASIMSIEKFARRRDSPSIKVDDETVDSAEFLTHHKFSLEEYNEEVRVLYQCENSPPKEVQDGLVGRILVCIVHYIYLEQILGAPLNFKEDLLSQADKVLEFWAKQPPPPTEDTHKGISLFAGILYQWDAISRASIEPQAYETRQDFLEKLHNKIASPTNQSIAPCPPRILAAINGITSLSNWKCQCSEAGTLSMLNLARRADLIEQDILAELAFQESRRNSTTSIHQGRSCTSKNRNPLDKCVLHQKLLTSTALLFAHAARIYLHVVLSGANPKVNEIRKSVKKALRVLRESDADNLGMVVWPLVVIGSMTGNESEGEFLGRRWIMEKIAEIVGELKDMRWMKIRNLLEECWDKSGENRALDCSWTASLKTLGLPGGLLV